jgi:hypothetical protein
MLGTYLSSDVLPLHELRGAGAEGTRVSIGNHYNILKYRLLQFTSDHGH